METFRADFLKFFTKKRLNLAITWTTENSPKNPGISGIFLKFPYFLSNVLELIFSNFLPKNDEIWLFDWRLETCHQIQHFRNFFKTFCFRVEWFRADFLQFFSKKRLTLVIGWTAKNLPSNPSISGSFFKFSNFLLKVLDLISWNFLPRNV